MGHRRNATFEDKDAVEILEAMVNDCLYNPDARAREITSESECTPGQVALWSKKYAQGRTLYAELTIRRLEASKKDLEDGINIDSGVGFGTESSFRRAFTKYVGMTPKQYAKQHQAVD